MDNTFNIVISGSREFTEFNTFANSLDDLLKVKRTGKNIRLLEGGARGIDRLALRYAIMRGIKRERFDADWDKFGKRAGILRNIEMINAGDMVIAFWDGKSKGTKHAIDYAIKKSKRCIVVRLDKGMSVEEVIPIRSYENRRMSDKVKELGWDKLIPLLNEEFPQAA